MAAQQLSALSARFVSYTQQAREDDDRAVHASSVAVFFWGGGLLRGGKGKPKGID